MCSHGSPCGLTRAQRETIDPDLNDRSGDPALRSRSVSSLQVSYEHRRLKRESGVAVFANANTIRSRTGLRAGS